MNSPIHRPDDGRGVRDVFVNGNRIEPVVWADTRAGAVWYCPLPLRITRHGEVYQRRLRGHVEVIARE